jgi:aspartate kinase
MKVFKFGGASVKDAQAVRNVSHILSLFTQDKLIVVISAMGKTTNSMEEIVDALWKRDEKKYQELVEERYQFHLNIVGELFPEPHFAIYQKRFSTG